VADSWATYLCNVNSELASILLNISLISDENRRQKPELLWIWVYLLDPRPDGLTKDYEASVLYKVEDAISESLGLTCSAAFAGRITTKNRREFYFYGDHAEGFDGAVRTAMTAFPEYRFTVKHEPDPDWLQYRNVLYPTPEEFQRISNQDVLDALKKNGDDHGVPRLVQHWAFFASEDQRTSFATEAILAGFAVDSEYLLKTETPFAICVGKTQSVETEQIDDSTLILFRLCEKLGGTYDGWETFATSG